MNDLGTEIQTKADSTHTVRATPKLTTGLRKKGRAESLSLSHSDSAFFCPQDTTFCQICQKETDIAIEFYGSRWDRTLTSDSMPSSPLATLKPTAETLLEPEPRGTTPLRPYADVVVCMVCAVVVVLGIVRLTGKSFLTDIAGFFTDSNGWKRLEQSSASAIQTSVNFLLLDAVYVAVISTLAIESAICMVPDGFDIWNAAGALTTSIVAFYALRGATDKVIGFAFRAEKALLLISLNRRAARAMIGLTIAPLALFMPFVGAEACEVIIKIACFAILLITCWRIIKSIRINSTSLPSLLYFILYLCIVEAMPIICIARLVIILSGKH